MIGLIEQDRKACRTTDRRQSNQRAEHIPRRRFLIDRLFRPNLFAIFLRQFLAGQPRRRQRPPIRIRKLHNHLPRRCIQRIFRRQRQQIRSQTRLDLWPHFLRRFGKISDRPSLATVETQRPKLLEHCRRPLIHSNPRCVEQIVSLRKNHFPQQSIDRPVQLGAFFVDATQARQKLLERVAERLRQIGQRRNRDHQRLGSVLPLKPPQKMALARTGITDESNQLTKTTTSLLQGALQKLPRFGMQRTNIDQIVVI